MTIFHYILHLKGIEKWRVKNYSIYYDINENKKFEDHFEILNEKFSDNLDRLKNYYFDKTNDFTSNKLGAGIQAHSASTQTLAETGKSAAKRHTINIMNNPWFNKNLETINVIIEFAKQRNAKVIFITCPAYYTYVENLQANQLNNTIKLISRISILNSNTSYYNFLKDSSFTDKDFYDADHLNKNGARKFTIKIDSLISINDKNKIY